MNAFASTTVVSAGAPVAVVTNIDGIVQDVPMESATVACAPLDGMLAIYSTGDAATAVCPKDGKHVIIKAKKNNSRGEGADDGWQVFAVIPGFGSVVDSLGAWSDVVNAVLLQQASDSLKAWRLNNPMAGEVHASMFSAAQLREDYLAGGSGLSMDKETLEKLFCASATYQSFVGSDKFKFNAQYRTLVEIFKGKVVALAGRGLVASVTDLDLDKIVAKIHDEDLSTQFGAYVLARVSQLKKKREEEETEIDLDAL